MGYNPVDMGRRIAAIRKKCVFSQFELAEALYVSNSYISKQLLGKANTTL